MRSLVALTTLVTALVAAAAVDARRSAPLATFIGPNADIAMPDGHIPDDCIPDATVSTTIAFASGAGTVSDVNVGLRITHTFADDVRVRLLHTPPGGPTTTLMLLGHTGGSANGFGSTTYPSVPDFILDDEAATDAPDLVADGSVPLVGTYRPKTWATCPAANPLSGVDGQDAAGTWVLEAGDTQLLGTGTYNYWALDVTTSGTPTSAKLARFTAVPGTRRTVLTWRTASETETAGFNIFRNTMGREVRVNRSLLRAKASGRPWGAEYRFVDLRRSLARSVTYRLESVGLDGSRGTIGVAALAG